MKIVVTSQGKELSSEIDPRFGRAKWLVVIDTETADFLVHDNTVNLNAVQGAGIQTGQNIANLNVEAVITGNVGPNAFKTLNAAGVKIFLAEKQTVAEALESFKTGKLKEVDTRECRRTLDLVKQSKDYENISGLYSMFYKAVS